VIRLFFRWGVVPLLDPIFGEYLTRFDRVMMPGATTPTTARYARLRCIQRGTQYGFSLWEFQIH
jgi:hypothetical protein